jgi:hypothetical protein
MADIEINVSVPLTDVNLPCGDGDADYTVQATITEQLATCTGADFNNLYDLIEKIVDKNCQAVKCTSGCNRLGPFILAQSWDCATSAQKHVAKVRLTKRVYCTRKNSINFPFPTRPTQPDLQKPGNAGQFPDDRGTDHTEIEPLKMPSCGDCVAVQLTYKQEVKECTAGMDLGPYLKQANDRADDFISFVRCESPCTVKIEDRRHTEKCESKVVTVTIDFKLCCVRPAPLHPH